jgi:putative hemolysin
VERLAQASQPVLPAYRAHLDDIVGVVRVRDLFRAIAGSEETIDLTPLLREPLTVPDTVKADDLLNDMRARRTSLAIVIDEYGGTAGMVTFERLMERIVGEIGADDGGGVSAITVLTDGSALIDGLALVTDVNAQFGLSIDENLYDTIGGFVLGRLGRRPRLGDAVEIGGRRIRIEALDGLRVARVLLAR